MKFSKSLALLFIAFLLTNCSKDETPAPKPSVEEQPDPENEGQKETEVYFTYRTSFAGNGDNWVVLHDTDGNLIDFAKTENGGPVEFSAHKDSVPEKFTMTEFFHGIDSGNKNESNSLLTYTNVEKGGYYSEPFSGPYPPQPIGSFDLRVENIPGIKSRILSNSRGLLNAGESNTEGDFTNASLALSDIPLFENERYVLNIYDNSGGHKYILIEDPEKDANLIVDYTDFIEHDSYINIDLPNFESVFLSTSGYNEEKPNYAYSGLTFSNIWTFNSSGTIRAGYLDGYENYRTDFGISLSDYAYAFSKVGDKMENIEVLPKPTFELHDASIHNFKIQTNLEFLTKTVKYNYGYYADTSIVTNWTVLSEGSDNHVIGNLPEEILSKYPNLNLSNARIQSVRLNTHGLPLQALFDGDPLTIDEKNGFIDQAFIFSNFE
ncbi:MAG: hypothetical protein ACR2MT_01890 [Aurantibacter sp.]